MHTARAFNAGVAGGKRLTYHTPTAVKPKLNAFDKAKIGNRLHVTSGDVTIKGRKVSCGLKKWIADGGKFGGPDTNGLADFDSDETRQAAREAKKIERKITAEAYRELHSTKIKDLQAHMATGPRLRISPDKFRLVSGETAHDPLPSRIPESVIKHYPALESTGTRYFRVKDSK